MTVRHKEHIVMHGTGTPPGLWKFKIPVPATIPAAITQEVSAFSSIGYPKAAELVAYSHATLFSPALSTLEQAIKKGLYAIFRASRPKHCVVIHHNLSLQRKDIWTKQGKICGLLNRKASKPTMSTPATHRHTH